MANDKKTDPAVVDVGACCRAYVKAWRARQDAEAAQKTMDGLVREAGEVVRTALHGMEGTLPADKVGSRTFSCEGWIVTVTRPIAGQGLIAWATPDAKAEAV